MSVKKSLYCKFEAISTKFGEKIQFDMLITNIPVSMRSDNKWPLKTVIFHFQTDFHKNLLEGVVLHCK